MILTRRHNSERITVLRVVLRIGETSGPYNLLSLPLVDRQEITILTYFKSLITVPREIRLIDGNNTLPGFLRGLKLALRKKYDVIHAHTPHVGLLYILYSILKGRYFFVPKIFTVHTAYENFKLRNKLMLIPIFILFKRIIFCSEASFQSFPALFCSLAGKRTRVIQNGVDLDRIDSALISEACFREKSGFQIVNVGGLRDQKNQGVLLDAFSKCYDNKTKLKIIGEGPLRERIEKRVQCERIQKHVELTGLIPREDVYWHLARANLFVSPSVCEGLPLAVLEAMACRCPVILSDIGPHREIASRVDFIPLLSPKDVDGFAREIKRIRDMSPLQRKELGDKCRNLVQERFPLKAMNDGYVEVCKEAIVG